MNRHHPSRSWPRNESPAARALVLIEWVLRHQPACAVAVLVVTAVVKGLLP